MAGANVSAPMRPYRAASLTAELARFAARCLIASTPTVTNNSRSDEILSSDFLPSTVYIFIPLLSVLCMALGDGQMLTVKVPLVKQD